MRKLLCFSLGLVLSCTSLWAQNRTVTGTVTDENGKPLSNASVQVKGTTLGTTTNENGQFTIAVPANGKALVVTSVGQTNQEIALGATAAYYVSLKPVQRDLDEVVVVAYGTVKKGEYTGSSAQVNAKEIANRPVMNVTSALVGSAPGIQTTAASGQPGSGPAIRLRGFGSIYGSSAPLVVVDGVVYDGGLANINPDDVESISTLKDASTTALYGSRGGNGVIMITTKKGNKNKPTLNFKVTQGFSERGLPEYDRVNAFEYYPLMWEAYRNAMAYSSTVPLADAGKIAAGQLPRFTTGANAGRQNYNNVAYSDISQLLAYNPFNVANTAVVNENGVINPAAQIKYPNDMDWTASVGRRAPRKDYNLSYNGGNEKSDYLASFGYTNEQGYLINSDFKRFTGRVAVNAKPTNWFKSGFNLSGTLAKSAQGNVESSTSLVNPFYFSRYIAPIYPVYAHNQTTGQYLLDGNGDRIYDYGNLSALGVPNRPFNGGRHAIAENLWNDNKFTRNIISGRAYADINFTSDLKFTTNISADIQNVLSQSYQNKIVGDGAPGGRSSRTGTVTTSYTFNQLLQYARKFGKHNVNALVGHENYDYTYNYLYGFKQGQIADGNTELLNFAVVNSTSSYTDKSKLESYLSRLNYDFAGKYFITGSLRRDGNSRFATNVRWADFWSVGAAYRLDKENFMNYDFIDQIKLRGSYGKVGNDAGIGLYPYQALYNLGFNNNQEPGYTLGTLANQDLTWESSKSFDVGVDFGLFKNRITGTVEYFKRVSDGLIFAVPQPLANGGTTGGVLSVNQNIGSMYNKGIELTLGADVVRSKNVTWNVTLNGTTLENKITKMPVGRKEIIDGTKKLMEGQSIYDFWLRDFYGVDPTDGAALYAANNTTASSNRIIDNKGRKDTVTTDINNAKYIYTGTSSIPDFYGSVINRVNYKGLELAVTLTFQKGGQVYDGAYASLMHAGTYGTALSRDILNRWQKPGDITNVPRLDNSKTGVYDAASNRWLIDASYLNVNNISLSYNLPKSWTSRINSTGVRVFTAAENVYQFSKRKGMNVNGSFAGTTGNSYSFNRVITAGVNVTF